MSEQCVLYNRECIDCGECDICDLDRSKHCDNCGKCLDLTKDYLSLDVKDFMKKSVKADKKIKKIEK